MLFSAKVHNVITFFSIVRNGGHYELRKGLKIEKIERAKWRQGEEEKG